MRDSAFPADGPLFLEKIVERHFGLDVPGICVFLYAIWSYVCDMDGLVDFCLFLEFGFLVAHRIVVILRE